MSHDPHHIIEVLPVHLRLALPEEVQGGGTRSNWANQRLLRTCLMALRSLTIDMTSFCRASPPEPQINYCSPAVHVAVRGRTDGLSALVGALRPLVTARTCESGVQNYISVCAIMRPSWHGRRRNVDGRCRREFCSFVSRSHLSVLPRMHCIIGTVNFKVLGAL